MKRWKMATASVLMAGTITGAALACGTPPVPPPPPPPPPIVCCVVMDDFIDPADCDVRCIIIRYFRRDGLPLFQSNPMPLLPGQRCLCVLPGASAKAIQAGAVLVATHFGHPKDIPWQGIPPSLPPYEPGQPGDPGDPIKPQIEQAYGLYLQAAGQDPTQDIRPPEGGDPCQVFDVTPKDTGQDPVCRCDLNGDGVIDFQDCDEYLARLGDPNLPDCDGDGVGGTAADLGVLCNTQTDCPNVGTGPTGGGFIPPNIFFDIYQKFVVPLNFDPRCLCDPNQIWILGLFLDDNGSLLIEPCIPDGTGIPLPLYDPDFCPGAIMKFRWYWPIIPPPCPLPPPFCLGDADGSGRVDFGDINGVLGSWSDVCPPGCPVPPIP